MPDLNALRRAALVLVLIGLLWNMVEAGVSLWAGAEAGSVAMLAFGLDSIVELFAGGVLVWRLTAGRDEVRLGGCRTTRPEAGRGQLSSCWPYTL